VRQGEEEKTVICGPHYIGGDATPPLFEGRWGVFLVATKKGRVIGGLLEKEK
jgi:hypothetical protein